nr:ATP-binding protein [Legionella micdadei]
MEIKNIEALNIVADKSKLLQILVNIIQNAKDAVLENQEKKEKKIEFIVNGKKPQVNIQIIDNGIGISPEHLERIFSFGFTTKENGHGFGLHSSALSAQDMGGSLRAESEGIGKGAKFILTLPIKETQGKEGIVQ